MSKQPTYTKRYTTRYLVPYRNEQGGQGKFGGVMLVIALIGFLVLPAMLGLN